MKTEKKKAIRKIRKAIDALIAVQDLGQGTDAEQRCLDILNRRANTLESEVAS